jgi:hypothetical protein
VGLDSPRRGLVLLLAGKSLNDALGPHLLPLRPPSSAPAADGIAVIAAAIGVFGLLMALFLGLLPGSGVRLSGSSLRGVLIWSFGTIALAAVLFFAGSGRAAPRRPGGPARRAADTDGPAGRRALRRLP